MKYIIVGCGITGVTIGRLLAEAGQKVEIWERRNHIAGNMYDYIDEYGILVHKYGPHIFHTNNEEVWKFVNQFEEWKPFKLVCGASWDGKYTPTAFNFKTIDVFYLPEEAEKLKKKLLEAYPERESATVVEMLENSDPDIRGYAEFLFKNDYAPYTAKQWGVSPEEIDRSVLKRVPIRFSYDESYFTDKYEAMPVHGYTKMFEKMLEHENIKVKLGVDALDHLKVIDGKMLLDGNHIDDTIIYTGAIDELLEFRYGRLPYRSLRFEWKYEPIDSLQEAPVVAYPQEPRFTRITEYKKLPVQNVAGSSYAIEYPLPYKSGEVVEPYYPVPTEESKEIYKRYMSIAGMIPNLVICGRLAEFKYYNMDQVIAHAMDIANELLESRDRNR